MGYVLLGAVLGLIPSLMILVLFIQNNRSHEKDRQNWTSERESLLNRCMTKEWQSYQMMTLAPQSSSSPFEPYAGEYIPGMSDEEELKRMGVSLSEVDGLGEEVLTDEEAEAFRAFGLRAE